MKILQVGKFYPIMGGVEKVMYDLVLGLSAEKIHCDMLCATTENHPGGTLILNDYAKIFVIPTQIKLAATMLAPNMIVKLRQIAHNYDIIHIHHPDPMASLALFLSGYKGKVVLQWHADILKQKTLLKLYKPLQSWLIKRANIIVGTTPVYVKESPFLTDVQHKIDFIPIGIEPLIADSARVDQIKETYKNKKIIFSLGRLVAYKGYEYLIKAAEDLDDSYHIVIGGKGPLHDELTALITSLKLSNKVSLIGFVSDEDLPNYYAASDVFCLSSIWKTEAFAIVQIEAMSFGKPIISTHIPTSGVSWVNAHQESGIVVSIESPKEISTAIKDIFENEATYKKLAEGSAERYKNLFTRKKMIDKCLSIYKKLV
ncbi:glycosyltransferase [Sphingobacteriaceae bacterium WQ 2009]|uniref:Glycosyltransferase n=1 Tax=Rhinopithecimicrobium faecis TaxID=2820698 RepID=A0A8T4H9X8_9SPHI|nr:glycosyltransferase [Sphingobacteriaceae bacterium WQ 2009]